MTLQNISFEKEKEISVSYKDTPVGKYRLDFLVEEKVIVELKAVETLNDVHLSQMLSYLSATSKKIGQLCPSSICGAPTIGRWHQASHSINPL